ncbi:hypothetical protein AMK22_03130 [Streptomyces sp. CB01580]|nr:hypothetical protein AMK22_03130 [Streptomyces sp. CB01580]
MPTRVSRYSHSTSRSAGASHRSGRGDRPRSPLSGAGAVTDGFGTVPVRAGRCSCCLLGGGRVTSGSPGSGWGEPDGPDGSGASDGPGGPDGRRPRTDRRRTGTGGEQRKEAGRRTGTADAGCARPTRSGAGGRRERRM